MNLFPDWPEIYRIRQRLLTSQESRTIFKNPYVGTQPLHVVYGGAQLFSETTLEKVGELAKRHWAEMFSSPARLAKCFELDVTVSKSIFQNMERILKKMPVVDYRIDFEDGYGVRSAEEEDRDAVKTAKAVAEIFRKKRCPESIGIRVKSLSQRGHFERTFRTLYLFLDRLFQDTGGKLPKNFVVTLPKVESANEVSCFVDLLELIESRSGVTVGAVQLELMIESGRGLFTDEGNVSLPAFLTAARGRCRGIHLGVYDFLSDLGVSAPSQSLNHSHCRWARSTILAALGGTDLFFSDGATLKLPLAPSGEPANKKRTSKTESDRRRLLAAWRLSVKDIERQLRNGIYQGWDLHPNQIPIRYFVNQRFFELNAEAMLRRLQKFTENKQRASQCNGDFDDRASILGVWRFFQRGRENGAFSESWLRENAVPTQMP